eukprot:8778786-Alexandrium_andersonii.AAC.1
MTCHSPARPQRAAFGLGRAGLALLCCAALARVCANEWRWQQSRGVIIMGDLGAWLPQLGD